MDATPYSELSLEERVARNKRDNEEALRRLGLASDPKPSKPQPVEKRKKQPSGDAPSRMSDRMKGIPPIYKEDELPSDSEEEKETRRKRKKTTEKKKMSTEKIDKREEKKRMTLEAEKAKREEGLLHLQKMQTVQSQIVYENGVMKVVCDGCRIAYKPRKCGLPRKHTCVPIEKKIEIQQSRQRDVSESRERADFLKQHDKQLRAAMRLNQLEAERKDAEQRASLQGASDELDLKGADQGADQGADVGGADASLSSFFDDPFPFSAFGNAENDPLSCIAEYLK